MKGPARHKIGNFEYEIDERGHLFSTKDTLGYGIGYQIMPSKNRKEGVPTYKISMNRKPCILRADVLVEQYFISTESFDHIWYEATRNAAMRHNAELRAQFLKRKASGLPEPIKKNAHTRKERKPYTQVPWSNSYELEVCSRLEENYSAALGGDSRDALMCPLR